MAVKIGDDVGWEMIGMRREDEQTRVIANAWRFGAVRELTP